MAIAQHVKILRQGSPVWNDWRRRNPEVRPNLIEATLSGFDFRGFNLKGTDLRSADLTEATLEQVDLSHSHPPNDHKMKGEELCDGFFGPNTVRIVPSDLGGAVLTRANLSRADLSHAKLQRANLEGAELHHALLSWCDLTKARLRGARLHEVNLVGAKVRSADLQETLLDGCNFQSADLTGSDLRKAYLAGSYFFRSTIDKVNLSGANLAGIVLNDSSLRGATLTDCRVYGCSIWDVDLTGTQQQRLSISPHDQPDILIDDIEVAQFIYLVGNNKKIIQLVDAMTSRVVLILGRFTPVRKQVLDRLRDLLQAENFSPVIFDFDKPASKDTTGTIELLSRMASFIIADVSDPSSIPHELATIVPYLRTTPVVVVKDVGAQTYTMLKDLSAYPWVMRVFQYESPERLLAELPTLIAKAADLASTLRAG
jgi:uncharacterized protein YjbI with pentapeptide repeats